LLQPQLTDQEAHDGCLIAARYNVASVCVKPCHISLAKSILKGSEVAVGTVIGFPHGGHMTSVKVFEARAALEAGAVELDMVINIGKLRSGEIAYVRDEIAQIVEAAGDAIVKVILENAYLDQEQKVAAYRTVELAGGHYVKTSTGYAPSGSTVEDLRLMRATVGPAVKVKAAGGVRTLPALLAAIDAGADRVGATATAAILDAVDG
jgi:deoxyribose-phosphate aldolase